MCYDSFWLLSSNCWIKWEHNHSFRTFSILRIFPLKILNCSRTDVWQRRQGEFARKKCEFDMILIFKLHIALWARLSNHRIMSGKKEAIVVRLRGVWKDTASKKRSLNTMMTTSGALEAFLGWICFNIEQQQQHVEWGFDI